MKYTRKTLMLNTTHTHTPISIIILGIGKVYGKLGSLASRGKNPEFQT